MCLTDVMVPKYPKGNSNVEKLGYFWNSDRRNCYLQFQPHLMARHHRRHVCFAQGALPQGESPLALWRLEGMMPSGRRDTAGRSKVNPSISSNNLWFVVICRDAIGKPFFHMGSLQDGGGPQERGNRRGNPHLNTPTSPPMASNAHHISAAMLSSVLYSPQTWQSSLTGWWMHMFHWGITNSDRDLKTVQEIKESRSSQHG